MESVENFRVVLRSPSNGVVIAQSVANISINNVIGKEVVHDEDYANAMITISHDNMTKRKCSIQKY